jgi:hypothetical protein
MFITAPGKAFFPHLDHPDTDFGGAKYKTGLILDEEGFAPFKKALDAFVKENWKKPKQKPKLPYKKQSEEHGGGYLITPASNYRPAILNAKNGYLYNARNEADKDKELFIGGGSILRCAIGFNVYDTGINLYLYQVQVIKLVEFIPGGSAFGEAPVEEEDDDEEGSAFDTADEPDEEAALDI